MLPEESRALLLSPPGAAARLGISMSTLDRWVKEGRLKCVRLSDGPKSQRRFTLGALEDAVNITKGGLLD